MKVLLDSVNSPEEKSLSLSLREKNWERSINYFQRLGMQFDIGIVGA